MPSPRALFCHDVPLPEGTMLTVLTARGLCAWACVRVTINSCTSALRDPLLPSLFVPVLIPGAVVRKKNPKIENAVLSSTAAYPISVTLRGSWHQPVRCRKNRGKSRLRRENLCKSRGSKKTRAQKVGVPGQQKSLPPQLTAGQCEIKSSCVSRQLRRGD